ncbi:MAG: LamG domain-containing protein, partial [Sedimentisphaerales bacterium]|nr:LamG domain-containing protein [Sedimentisphaerales bacterium]
INIGADLGASRTIYGPRSFDGKNYIVQITPATHLGLGTYPVDSPDYEALCFIGDGPGVRMAAPFPTADYVLTTGSYNNDLFSRFDPNLAIESRVFAATPATRPNSFDWVDDDTIIYGSYLSGLRTNLYLADINAEPFTVTPNAMWNANGYVTTPATVRIRGVRVGDVYSNYAYYGDAEVRNNAGFWAINLATGVSTKLGELDYVSGDHSWGLFTVKEVDGYLYVHTTDDGIYIYNMIDATTLGTLHSRYTKNLLDILSEDTETKWGFDVVSGGARMLLSAGDGRVIEFGLPRVDAGDDQVVMWPDEAITLQLDATIVWHIGEPNPPDLVITWSQLEGPSTALFDPCNTEDTSVTFDAPGLYKLNIRVAQGEDIVNDEISVRVKTETDDRLVAHWDFEEGSGLTVNDDSANNNTGDLAGNYEPNWVSGWIKTPPATTNMALEFYGESPTKESYVKITTDLAAADPNLNNLQQEITLSAWVKINDTLSEYPVILAKGIDSWRMGVMTTEDERNNSIYFTCQGLGIQSVYSNAKLNDGYWHNVVGTWDGTTQSLYIDGILDNSQLNWGQINTNDLPATIGARAISATEAERSWNGLIDDVRIYSYAIPLTKAEGGDDSVEGLYEMGLPLCYGDILDGDFNENCYIDLLDFGALSASWMDSYGMDDLAALAANWLSCNHPLDPECELPF